MFCCISDLIVADFVGMQFAIAPSTNLIALSPKDGVGRSILGETQGLGNKI